MQWIILFEPKCILACSVRTTLNSVSWMWVTVSYVFRANGDAKYISQLVDSAESAILNSVSWMWVTVACKCSVLSTSHN